MTGKSPKAPDHSATAWVCLGVITKPKGVRGQVRITSFTAAADDLLAYGPLHDGPGGPIMDVTLREVLKGGVVVAAIAGVTDRDQAEALRGIELHVPRDALPEAEGDEYYHADLVGLTVEGPDGVKIGTVAALHNYGAGDILEVTGDDGDGIMLAFTRETVPEVDIPGGRLVIDPPPETSDGKPET